MLPKHYDAFFDLMKHSQFGNTTKNIKEKASFEENYINSPLFLSALKPVEPQIYNHPGMIPFCEKAPQLLLSNISFFAPLGCNYFQDFITPKGICHTFNSLSMTEIFKNSEILQSWKSTFDLKPNLDLVKPEGYGPYHGLNFVLNSFLPNTITQSSSNFILAITNKNNPFDIFKQNFIIEPGFAYTFKIIAYQIGTTNRFNALERSIRNCHLPYESNNLNLTKFYTKSACEFECAIKQAKEVYQCLPWNIPRTSTEDIPFCDHNDQEKFDKQLRSVKPGSVT